MYNSLSQTVIKLTAPGVPDLYQGTELWDFSLVDPDNRRPVDYDRRRQMLQTLQSQVSVAGNNRLPLVRELMETWEDGRVKLYVTHQTLIYRREHPDLFRTGGYIPLEAIGQRQKHLCSFARRHGGKTLVVVAPRLLSQVIPDPTVPPLGTEVWAETWLALPPDDNDHPYLNLLTREKISPHLQRGRWCLSLGEIFAYFPVALLEAVNQ
jgi:(1->4)-alpha-D-glucan 1-alpha-D-glucosylmutase